MKSEIASLGSRFSPIFRLECRAPWGGDHHDRVRIFILYRQEPSIDISHWPLVTPVSDIKTAMANAKKAAGEKNVLVHGAAIARLALAAGVLDELELHVVPVLLGQGRRLFDGLAPGQIELQRTRILEGEAGVIHMHYRVHAALGAASAHDDVRPFGGERDRDRAADVAGSSCNECGLVLESRAQGISLVEGDTAVSLGRPDVGLLA